MDNFKIDIVAEGSESLATAVGVAFKHNAPGRKAEAYAIDGDKGLVFLWSLRDCSAAVPFPFKMDAKGAADFAERWLAEQDYGRQPGHDGDNGKGWRVYCEGWGHVGSMTYAICAVKPVWAMYGK